MRLSLEEIKGITSGAVQVVEESDGIHFHRFTQAQEELYRNEKPQFYHKCLGCAGIRLEFQTNSSSLSLKIHVGPGSSRTMFSLDVVVDGRDVGNICNYIYEELPEKYSVVDYPLGEYEKTFSLGEGEKKVCIYLPWSVNSVIEELCLDDGAYIRPVKREKKVLVFGDSITQGYDALRSFHRYGAQMADAFGWEEVNKAIGGEQFFPALAEKKDDFTPDYIMVAYGTNDWAHSSRKTIGENCLGFFKGLRKNYPDTPIVVITPIWRIEYNEHRSFGPFQEVDGFIREVLSEFDNITIIRGYDFVPHDVAYFADRRVHPNDKGFAHYFEHLHKEFKKL